jgi:hypothetical protein
VPNHIALGYSTECQECHTSMDSWTIAVLPHAKMRR